MTSPSTAPRAAALLALCAFFMIPAPAAAQETEPFPVPIVELSAGYTFMRDFSMADDVEQLGIPEHLDFPAGWYLSAAVNPLRWLGVVGEATGSYRNNFDFGDETFTISNDVRIYTLMAGPRFFYQRGRFAPFGQVLAGAAHGRLKTTFPSESGFGTMRDSVTNFALQPGGGLTVYLTDRLGMRAAPDYRRIFDFEDETHTNEFRIAGGFTLNWGRR